MHDNIREMEAQIATFAYRYDVFLRETKSSVDDHAASLRISIDDITAMRTGKAMPEPALVVAIVKDLWIEKGFLEGDSPYARWTVESRWLNDAMEYAGLSIPMLAKKAENALDHLFAHASGMRRIPVTQLGRYCVETGYPIDPRIFVFFDFPTSEQMKSKLTEDLKEAKPLSDAAKQLIDQIVQLDRDGLFDARTVAAFNSEVALAKRFPFAARHLS